MEPMLDASDDAHELALQQKIKDQARSGLFHDAMAQQVDDSGRKKTAAEQLV